MFSDDISHGRAYLASPYLLGLLSAVHLGEQFLVLQDLADDLGHPGAADAELLGDISVLLVAYDDGMGDLQEISQCDLGSVLAPPSQLRRALRRIVRHDHGLPGRSLDPAPVVHLPREVGDRCSLGVKYDVVEVLILSSLISHLRPQIADLFSIFSQLIGG